MLRKIVIVVVFLMVAYMLRVLAGHYYAPAHKPAPAQATADISQQQQLAYSLDSLNGRMPMTVLEGALRMESADMKDKVLHILAVQVNKPDETDSDRPRFAQYGREAYCKGMLHSFAAAGIPVQYNFRSPPRGLDDLRVDTWIVSLQPADCR
jgi:hypothetical protein